VGALKSAVLGYYDLEHRAYRKIAVDEQVELLSLIGDFAIDNGKPVLHAHVVVGRQDGSMCGGHLIKAYASPTTEVFVTTSPVELQKTFDPVSGLGLITIQENH
jgi:predicted DNA-binding protein with PD1-like motif